MGAHGDAVLLGSADRGAKDDGVAGVKARGDVGRRDRFHQPGVVADGVGAERLADVGVEIDAQQRGPQC